MSGCVDKVGWYVRVCTRQRAPIMDALQRVGSHVADALSHSRLIEEGVCVLD